jgi:hypothetical protein
MVTLPARIKHVLLGPGEYLGRPFSDCLIHLIGLQTAAGQVFKLEEFGRATVRKAEFIAAAVRDGLVLDQADTINVSRMQHKPRQAAPELKSPVRTSRL